MNKIIKIVLALAIIGLSFYLYKIVRDPILQQQEWDRIKDKRVARLEKIREAQIIYRDLNGEFSDNWDSLITMIKEDQMPVIRTIGDPHAQDTMETVISDTSYVAVRDSFYSGMVNPFPPDSLPYIPEGAGAKWSIEAGQISRSGITLEVFRVRDTKPYRSDFTLQVGSMRDANYSGNWK
ncbi:MAG: hypothetical protein WD077_07155 [Bacteroidia bacterium]